MGAPEALVGATASPKLQEAARDTVKTEVSKDLSSIVDSIFLELSDDEKEQAARASSYRYLVASTSPTEQEGRDQTRDKHAKASITRYVTVEQKLDSSKSPDEWKAAACTKLRSTLQFRKEKDVDAIRLCFKENLEDKDSVHANIRDRLMQRFSNKASVVRGYTKDGRAMFQNFANADTQWEQEYFIKGNIYMMERAIACTERNTNGEKDKIIVLYDYNGYGRKNSPPPLLVKELLSNLRDHWPERLQHVFVVDAPFIFRAFWAIIKHFIDPITKNLVQFVTGEEQKQVFRDMISKDQAAPFMFEGGDNGDEVDIVTFFHSSFDHVYGEWKRLAGIITGNFMQYHLCWFKMT